MLFFSIKMTKDEKNMTKKNEKKHKHRLFKPRKKKSVEEDAAIQYLKAQYDKVPLLIFYTF